MAIRSFFQTGIFDERATQILTEAFEMALRIADVGDRLSPDAELLARHIILLFEKGEEDPGRIARKAAGKLGLHVVGGANY
jgi:hypothetical protein